MRWDRLFEDLEDQLASEWEAERAALDSEAERLRLARVTLRDRLISLTGQGGDAVAVEFADASVLRGAVTTVGADFAAMRVEAAASGLEIVRLDAVCMLALSHEGMLRSARPEASAPRSALADRVTFGFVLRDVARRRLPVRIILTTGRAVMGTVDRVGADHLDLALHDPGSPRRASEVTGHRMLAFAAIQRVRLDDAAYSLP